MTMEEALANIAEHLYAQQQGLISTEAALRLIEAEIEFVQRTIWRTGGWVAGWYDNNFYPPRVYDHLDGVKRAFPLLFVMPMTEEEMYEAVYGERGFNSEGNFHEFVFRRAFPFESKKSEKK